MKKKIKNIVLRLALLLLVSYSLNSHAQVTIGTGSTPVSGSLLQLKQDDNANANSTKGLGMPRVNLTNKTALYPMFETVAGNGVANAVYNDAIKKAAQDAAHTGLIVYHIDKCTFGGAGLYVWDGATWEKLGEDSANKLSLSTTTLNFASGHDARGATIPPQTFDVSWSPNGSGTTAPTWTPMGGLLVPNMTPASGSLSITPPQTMTVQLAAIPLATITANPFASLSKTITFNRGLPCNLTKDITIMQTNKSLLVNGSLAPSQIVHTVDGTNQSIAITSNAKWKMSMTASTAVTNLNPLVGSVNGTEQTDGNGVSPTQKYDIATGAFKSHYTTLTFADNESPKRFNDVSITIAQCSEASDPTMEEWKAALVAANDGTLAINTPGTNGVAWHQDQNNNIFFSMNYDAANPKGNTNRWMTTNLAATTYGSRTVGTTWGTGGQPTLTNTYATNTPSYTAGHWGYPNPNATTTAGLSTTYDARKRLGLLYNWAAATGNQNPSVAEQDGINHAYVQGICPQGWHLPTDYEWTQLETEIKDHASKYSGLADGTANLAFAMIDMCEPTVGQNSSNVILNGGFSALFAGFADSGYSMQFGHFGLFWSSSSSATNFLYVWYHALYSDSSTVHHFPGGRSELFAVRCKKD